MLRNSVGFEWKAGLKCFLLSGYYCTGSAKTAMPEDGITGDLCPRGHFCPAGTAAPSPCPSGEYSNATGQELELCNFCVTWGREKHRLYFLSVSKNVLTAAGHYEHLFGEWGGSAFWGWWWLGFFPRVTWGIYFTPAAAHVLGL